MKYAYHQQKAPSIQKMHSTDAVSHASGGVVPAKTPFSRSGMLILLLMLVVFGAGYWYHDKNTESHEKFACETHTDCIVSYTDREGFEMCVNADYYADAPKTDGYLCLKTPDLSCQCRANRCERSDRRAFSCQ